MRLSWTAWEVYECWIEIEGVIQRCYDVRGHENWHEVSLMYYDEKVPYFHAHMSS